MKDFRAFRLVILPETETPQSTILPSHSSSATFSAIPLGRQQHDNDAAPDVFHTTSVQKVKQVFIGYCANSDSELVDSLHDKLKTAGANVWLDRHCLQGGMKWEEGSTDGLKNSDIFVPVLSKE